MFHLLSFYSNIKKRSGSNTTSHKNSTYKTL
nr:MAG TPA: hypothetical protein [Caudoviricetes sp.]